MSIILCALATKKLLDKYIDILLSQFLRKNRKHHLQGEGELRPIKAVQGKRKSENNWMAVDTGEGESDFSTFCGYHK